MEDFTIKKMNPKLSSFLHKLSFSTEKLQLSKNQLVKDGITKQFQPFVLLLRFVGRCPFTHELFIDEDGKRRIKYESSNSRNQAFWISNLLGPIVVTCNILAMLQSGIFGFHLPWLPKIKSIAQELMITWQGVNFLAKALFSSWENVLGAMGLSEYFIVWAGLPKLQVWLNKWNEIESDLNHWQNKFGKETERVMDISKFWKRYCLPYIIIPSVVLGPLVVTKDADFGNPMAFVVLVYTYLTTFNFLVEDAKAFLMFKTLELAFMQVRINLECREEDLIFVGGRRFPDQDCIRQISKIVVKVRKQGEVTGSYLATHQLLALAMLIYQSSSALFISVEVLTSHRMDHTIAAVVCFTIVSVVRLFFKVIMAVRITDEEKKLANAVKDLELCDVDKESRYELRALYNMITAQPTEISLNSYVHFNKSLMLGILGQVLTQFVVFMQFPTQNYESKQVESAVAVNSSSND